MKKFVLIAAIVIVAVACTNKNADYNNEVYLIHSGVQNALSALSEKLESEGISNDSAINFISLAEKSCGDQLQLLKKVKVPTAANDMHQSIDKLIEKQVFGLGLQKRLYVDTEPGKEFSTLQDSLDLNQAMIDSLDERVKALQINFAKANNFKLN